LKQSNYFFEHKKQNLPIKESLSKHLEDGIFEIRVSLFDKIVRNLYFMKAARQLLSLTVLLKNYKNPHEKKLKKPKFKGTVQSEAFKMTNYEKLFQRQMQVLNLQKPFVKQGLRKS